MVAAASLDPETVNSLGVYSKALVECVACSPFSPHIFTLRTIGGWSANARGYSSIWSNMIKRRYNTRTYRGHDVAIPSCIRCPLHASSTRLSSSLTPSYRCLVPLIHVVLSPHISYPPIHAPFASWPTLLAPSRNRVKPCIVLDLPRGGTFLECFRLWSPIACIWFQTQVGHQSPGMRLPNAAALCPRNGHAGAPNRSLPVVVMRGWPCLDGWPEHCAYIMRFVPLATQQALQPLSSATSIYRDRDFLLPRPLFVLHDTSHFAPPYHRLDYTTRDTTHDVSPTNFASSERSF